MKKNAIVVYTSMYGATRQYAQWIAESIGADISTAKDIRAEKLNEYDVVVYGGGLYAGGIAGIKTVAKNPVNHLVLFTVGLATPEVIDYSVFIDKHFSKDQQTHMGIFHLRGGMDYSELSVPHRVMMRMMKNLTQKTPESDRTDDDKMLLATYGKKVDFLDKASIEPLVSYVQDILQVG